MPIETTCPSCGATFRNVPDDLEGTEARCRECDQPFTIAARQADGPGELPEIPGELVAPGAAPQITFDEVSLFDGLPTPEPGPTDEPVPEEATSPRPVEHEPAPPREVPAATSRLPADAAAPTIDRPGEPPDRERGKPPEAADEAGQPPSSAADAAADDTLRVTLPIITRLEEIDRKCAALAERHPDIAEASPVLQAAIRSLRTGQGHSGLDLEYREVAASLLFMPRLFSSRGFSTLAREVEYVEKALLELHAAEREADSKAADAPSEDELPRAGPRVSSAAVRSDEEPVEGTRGPSPRLLFVLLVAAVAVATAAGVLLLRPDAPDAADGELQPTAVPTPAPTQPTPAPEPTRTQSNPNDGGNFAELLSKARRAVQEGDVDRALVQLSILSLVERRNSEVLDTAKVVIDMLKQRAEIASLEKDGLQKVRAELDRARELARRFELPIKDIDRLERHLASTLQVHRCSPRDVDTLRSLIGYEVRVVLDSGKQIDGVLQQVTADTLTLATRSVMGGGHVAYTTPVPVADIKEVVYTIVPT
jgi:hypothetical protein